MFGDDTHFDSRRDALGWKPSYVGIESRPLSALSVAGLPFAGVNGSAAAAARALTEALEKRGIAVDGARGHGSGSRGRRCRSRSTSRSGSRTSCRG